MPAPLRAVAAAPAPLADVVALPTRPRPVPPLVPLHVAAALTSVSDKLLWVEYLTLGGTADLLTFQEHLRRPDAWAADHDLVLEALEAVLLDEDVPVRVR